MQVGAVSDVEVWKDWCELLCGNPIEDACSSWFDSPKTYDWSHFEEASGRFGGEGVL